MAEAFSVEDINAYYGYFVASNDKEITGGFNVFNGRSNFFIRRKGAAGRPLVSADLRPEQLWSFVYAADKLAAGGPKTAVKMTLQEYDRANRKFVDKGVIALGIDDKFVPCLVLSTPDSGRNSFPIRLTRPSIANDELFTKNEMVAITIKSVFRDIAEHLTELEVLTSRKRQPGGAGAGRGNSPAGNRNYNNNYNNNSNNSNQGSSNSSASDPMDLDDSIPF